MSVTIPSDQEKAVVWQAYHAGNPTRVPVVLLTNPRVVLLNEQWNAEGWTFEQAAQDAEMHVKVSLQHELYRRRFLGQFCDNQMALPERWSANMTVYNVYEAAYFGAPIDFSPNQVPDTTPCYADDATKHEVFNVDIENPLENPFIRNCMKFWEEMKTVCDGMTFEGRPVDLVPWALCGTDGPVTVACNLRGADNFMIDLVADPEYADRLMGHIIQAAIIRRKAFESYWGDRIGKQGGMADDSCAMISNTMYEQQVLSHHCAFYEAFSDRGRHMHLCGDATRLFPLMHEQLGVMSFDTGFPVDHGALRDQLGDKVEIFGGPQVGLLMNGTADQVFQCTKSILQSGVMRGGRFRLREGNNLPPNVPEENLQAMYAACLEHGVYTA